MPAIYYTETYFHSTEAIFYTDPFDSVQVRFSLLAVAVDLSLVAIQAAVMAIFAELILRGQFTIRWMLVLTVLVAIILFGNSKGSSLGLSKFPATIPVGGSRG